MVEKTKSALCDPSAITIHRETREDFVRGRLGEQLGIKKEKSASGAAARYLFTRHGSFEAILRIGSTSRITKPLPSFA
jgi:hypothetical protein